jgi:1-acyl-sn-glycerol-3-phosphate acyltransferase
MNVVREAPRDPAPSISSRPGPTGRRDPTRPGGADRVAESFRVGASFGRGLFEVLRAGLRPARWTFPLGSPSWPASVPRPVSPPSVGVDYDTGWARREAIRLARAALLDEVVRPLVEVVATPTLEGLDLLEGLEPPAIFAANHSSHLDTAILVACLPRRFRHRAVVAAGADYFFDRRLKAHLSAGLLGAIPIERVRVNRRSSELAESLLEDGWTLVIFPEGGRSPDGWAQPFRGGAAFLSTRTGIPLVPVHIGGTRHILPKGATRLRPGPTTVTFGRPLRPEPGMDARRLAEDLESAVAVLADQATTDWWSARRRAAAGATPGLRGPEIAPWRRAWSLAGPARPTEPTWPRRRHRTR